MAARREFPACSLEIIFYRHPARSELNHLHDRKPAEHVLRVFPVRRLPCVRPTPRDFSLAVFARSRLQLLRRKMLPRVYTSLSLCVCVCVCVNDRPCTRENKLLTADRNCKIFSRDLFHFSFFFFFFFCFLSFFQFNSEL